METSVTSVGSRGSSFGLGWATPIFFKLGTHKYTCNSEGSCDCYNETMTDAGIQNGTLLAVLFNAPEGLHYRLLNS